MKKTKIKSKTQNPENHSFNQRAIQSDRQVSEEKKKNQSVLKKMFYLLSHQGNVNLNVEIFLSAQSEWLCWKEPLAVFVRL